MHSHVLKSHEIKSRRTAAGYARTDRIGVQRAQLATVDRSAHGSGRRQLLTDVRERLLEDERAVSLDHLRALFWLARRDALAKNLQ